MKPQIHLEPGAEKDEGDTWKVYLGSMSKSDAERLALRFRQWEDYLRSEAPGLDVLDVFESHPAVLVAVIEGEKELRENITGEYVIEVDGICDPVSKRDNRAVGLMRRQTWGGSRKGRRKMDGDGGE